MLEKLGFGTWGIGGDTGALSGYGPTEDDESKRAIECALEKGVNFFDTAPPYGNGKSEVLLGEVLSGTDSDAKVLTKVGVNTWDDNPCYSANFIDASLKLSKQRLGADKIDSVILHSLKTYEIADILEGYDFLRRQKDSGKIENIGISLKAPSDIIKLRPHLNHIDIIEVNFNMVDIRALETEFQEIITEDNIKVVARTPFAFGFLTSSIGLETRFHSSDHRSRWSFEQRQKWYDARREIQALAVRHGVNEDIESIALRFVCSFDFVYKAIPGMLSAAEVCKNSDAITRGPLSKDLISEIIAYNEVHREYLKI
jgi:aryl-alcohol dehydrogenase-like predicted oxidoreductase